MVHIAKVLLVFLGGVAQVDTTSTAIISVVEQKQLAELPLNGRNYSHLIVLAPGVQATGAGSAFYGRQQNYSVSGARPEGQEHLLDNTNIQGFWNHGAGSGILGATLGVEGIAEFSTQTNTYSAQFGGNGAAINVVTKSGTNNLHGSLYNYLRNDALDARGLFDPNALPEFQKNQFGGSLGGPIKTNKLFFFFNYEGIRQLAGGSRIVNVPDDNARNGLVTSNGLITPVPGGIHSAIRPLIEYYPKATRPVVDALGRPTGIGTATTVANDIGKEDYYLGRLDYSFSPKDSLFVRYVNDTASLAAPFSGSAIPLWPEQDRTANQYVTIEEKRTISSRLINRVRFSLVRTREGMELAGDTPGLSFYPGRQNGAITVTGLTGLGSSAAAPSVVVQNKFVYADDIQWTTGPHNFKFGGYVERVQTNINAPASFGGQFTFTGLFNFLQGNATSFFGPLPGQDDAYRDFREINIPLYFHDEWKVMPRLTLSIGLRYHYVTNPVTDKHPLYALVNPPVSAGFERVPHVFERNPNARNFDPRFGFAYDPFADHKTSVRGGFGIFHNPLAPRSYAAAYYGNPPYTLAAQLGPRFPTPFTSVTPALPSLSQGIDYRSGASPYQMQWNFSVQREVIGRAIVAIAYVGSRGIHQMRERDVNPPAPTISADGKRTFGTLVGGRPAPNARINPNFGFLNSGSPDANSNYNSLHASLRRRFIQNFQMQASYTWSKCLDDGSGSSSLEGAAPQLDPYDASLDYGPCSFDRRHALRLSGVVSLPFKGNKWIEGWQLSGIGYFATGAPFSPTVGFDQAGLQNGTGAQRPVLLPGRTVENARLKTLNQWFDPTAFGLPGVGQLGNLGRNAFTGPNSWNVDLGLSKSTRITAISDQFAVQFRAEFFNVLNHPNWGMPVTGVFTAAGPNGTGNRNPLAGRIQSESAEARRVQFALKLLF